MRSPRRYAGAVVTGAASGIGRAIALELAAREVPLLLADIDAAGLEETAQRARARGAATITAICDVRSADQVAGLAATAERELPGVELLFNNAGILVAGELADLSLEDYRRVIDVNLWGVIHGCHVFAPLMIAAGRGHIINTASLAGTIALPRMGAYSLTKAAVVSLSETLAVELAHRGVAVTALCPSFTASRFVDSSSGPASERTLAAGRVLIERLGASPARVARVAIDAVDRRALYAVPTWHGRAAWRGKRLVPAAFQRAIGLAQRALPT
jgi:short-subunit dehydrogenase